MVVTSECFCSYPSKENRGKLADELKAADAVVLTYACDKPSTLDRLSTFWLPELRRLEVCELSLYVCNMIAGMNNLFESDCQIRIG